VAPLRPHYEVPTEDGTVLLDPAREELPELVGRNAEVLARVGTELAGRPLRELRSAFRRSAVEAARRYLDELGLPGATASGASLIVTGHQPVFYHPGIWLKNFLTHWLARKAGGMGLNLVVDNDEARDLSLSVPVREGDGGVRGEVALGSSPAQLAYEEWWLPEPDAADRFVGTVLGLLEREDMREAFAAFAGYFTEACRQHPDFPAFMTAARCRYEAHFGLQNLELPVSRLCELPEFSWLFAHVLAELPRFSECYNVALADYRHRRGIRNRANPLPDLARGEGWLEAPFWLWRAGEPRRALRVALAGDDRVLLDGSAELLRLTGADLADGELVVGQLAGLRERGYKLRTRALTTTMMARLLVGDVFIHGVGGGNYDRITDAIIRSFLRIEPPAYVVASATVCLPFVRKQVRRDEVTRLLYLIRDLHCNPDRHLSADRKRDPEVGRLVEEKWRCIGRRGKTPLERREVFGTIRRINAELEASLSGVAGEARSALARASAAQAAEAVLGARNYAFCLFPQGLLRDFYGRVLS
jgi:hypothetical protein